MEWTRGDPSVRFQKLVTGRIFMEEKITLVFDISSLDMTHLMASDQRRDLMMVLARKLQNTDTGKRIGGTHTKKSIELRFQVSDYDKAVRVIRSVLKNHRLFPCMSFRRDQRAGL